MGSGVVSLGLDLDTTTIVFLPVKLLLSRLPFKFKNCHTIQCLYPVLDIDPTHAASDPFPFTFPGGN